MNFAKRLPLIILPLLGACATTTYCGRESKLLGEIRRAKEAEAFNSLETKLTDQSDIYLLYYFHLRRGELESNDELARAYTEYAREIASAYPEVRQCEENLK